MSKLKNFALATSLFIFGLMAKLPAEEFASAGETYYSGYGYDSDNNMSDWFCGDRFKFTAEFLYWKISEDDLEFARTESSTFVGGAGTETDPGLVVLSSNIEKLKFKWKPGQRYTLDYRLPCLEWDTQVVWTNFYSTAQGAAVVPTVGGDTENTLTALLFFDPSSENTPFSGFPTDSFSAIAARWRLNFNNVDWTLGKYVDLGCGFSVKPYGGLRYNQIKQHYDFAYVPSSIEFELVSGAIAQTTSSDYSGVGVVAGLQADWAFADGFTLFTNSAFGVTYGSIKNKLNIAEEAVFLGPDFEDGLLSFQSRDHIACPNVDLGVGLRWDYCICDFPIEVLIGWEYHHYFSQNAVLMSEGFSQIGDLNMHGFNVGAGISF